jgi:hypothetical protein
MRRQEREDSRINRGEFAQRTARSVFADQKIPSLPTLTPRLSQWSVREQVVD